MRLSSLSEQQRRIVEERAREDGFSCYFCGSTEPNSSRKGKARLGGFMTVVVKCATCGDDSSIVHFSAEDVAGLLKLDHRRNIRRLSETDGSGRAPRGY